MESQPPDQAPTLNETDALTGTQPLDAFLQTVNAVACVLALVAFASERERATFYLLVHGSIAALMFALAKSEPGNPERSPLLRLFYYWVPGVLVTALYFELSLVIPRIHPFEDYRYDHALQALDVWLLGDPAGAFAQLTTRLLSDVLTVCYTVYYPFIALVPAVLYARGEFAEFRQTQAIILVAFILTYVGYVAVPAVGPHLLFDGPRDAALDGYGIARRGYAMIRALPREPPDAFPSGHALFGLLVPGFAWRWCKPLFLWVLPIGIGIVLATLFLRYHYVVDVLAAFALAPVAWRLGCTLGGSRD